MKVIRILPVLLVAIILNRGLTMPDFQYVLPNYSHHQFENGFELILVENRSNPLIATIVVTKTGLRNETPENNGVSHMLEHLTFNGTTSRTQKQLYDELDYNGIYLNAQTSEDYTTYMALNHKNQIDQTLDIMSDMLFNSTFPEEKFEKEKGIVVEEIRKDFENNNFQKEMELRQAFYRNPPYSMPVIGTIETIEKMTRDQVVDYYDTYYSPNNMIAMVIGDLNREEMLQKFQTLFGNQESKDLPQREITLDQDFPFYHLQTNGDKQTITMKVPAPTFASDGFIPFQFYNHLGLDAQTGKIIEELRQNQDLGITKAASSFEFHPGFGILTMEIETPDSIELEEIKIAIQKAFRNFNAYKASETEIQQIQRSEAISEILQTDKILYYGFLKAQELAVGGIDAFEKIIPAVFSADPASVNRFIGLYTDTWEDPLDLFAEGDWTKTTDVDSYNPKEVQIKKSKSTIYRHTFNNGLRTILLQNTDNTVLAMHFLFKNRASWEPADKTGIVDFLHRSLFKSTENMDQETLQNELTQIGAEIKTNDWDFIPYDDYYNVPQYSYIRFLTLDQFFDRAMQLSYENIMKPNLAENFEDVKGQMLSLARRNSMNAQKNAQIEFYKLMFGETHPWTRPVAGNSETINTITAEDLQEMHNQYYTAGNTILAIVSSLDSTTVFSVVEKYFGEMPETIAEANPADIPVGPQSSDLAKTDSLKIGSQQSYIYLGYTFEAEPSYEIPLEITTNMLSGQIAFSLREQKGWAYRLGSRISNWNNKYIFYNYMGTGIENLRPAINGILDEINIFREKQLLEKDLQREKNSIIAALVRRRASRESQAYTLALNDFIGYPATYFFSIFDQISMVELKTIQQLKNEYLQTQRYHLFYTIPSDDQKSEEKPKMPTMMPH
jgi:predicted Zn-dependent peptidase